LGESLDALLTESMKNILLKPLDANILREAADAIFALALARPTTLEHLFQSLLSDPNSTIHETAGPLLQSISIHRQSFSEKLSSGQIEIGWGSPGLERYPSLNQFRKLFRVFVIDVRGKLITK
jgi:hypothetical protein